MENIKEMRTWLLGEHRCEVREIVSTVLVHIWTAVILVPGLNSAASQLSSFPPELPPQFNVMSRVHKAACPSNAFFSVSRIKIPS